MKRTILTLSILLCWSLNIVIARTLTCVEARTETLAMEAEAVGSEDVDVVGYVTSVSASYSGNRQSFWMNDTLGGSNVFQAYRCTIPSDMSTLTVGMKVKLNGKLYNYQGRTAEISAGSVSLLEVADAIHVNPTPDDMPATWPVSLPQLGDGRLKVVSQNLEYYYVQTYATTAAPVDYKTQAEMLDKTRKIAQAMVYLDADIYSFCEVELGDSALSFLASYMNGLKGSNVYQPIRDGLSGTQWCKNGYIYRSDRVAPTGAHTSGNTQQGKTYEYRQRIQAFRELSTNEVFVLSSNHFKSKSSDDQSVRTANATNLIAALNRLTIDPDILIVGDLNEQHTEPACQSLVAAGYAEQLLRFDSNAYSYYYNRSNELIDHIYANSSMASQITGAGAFHLNTSCYSGTNKINYRFSDHDAVLVAMSLGGATDIETVTSTTARRILYQGRIYIYRQGQFYTLQGEKLQ